MNLKTFKQELAKLDITHTEFYYIYGKAEKLVEDSYTKGFEYGNDIPEIKLSYLIFICK